ncbi:mercury resistance system transport protein MerF [Marinobacteraceae bacterium S3BR75-40.1]
MQPDQSLTAPSSCPTDGVHLTLGLAALTGYLDYVLLPALGVFIGLTVYAFWRKEQYDASYESNSNASRSFPSEK